MWDAYRPVVRLFKLLKYVNLFDYFCLQLHEISWVFRNEVYATRKKIAQWWVSGNALSSFINGALNFNMSSIVLSLMQEIRET
jgi:hypothetical protein